MFSDKLLCVAFAVVKYLHIAGYPRPEHMASYFCILYFCVVYFCIFATEGYLHIAGSPRPLNMWPDIKRNMKNMRIDIVPTPRYETLDKKGGVFAQSLGIFRVLSKILILYLPFWKFHIFLCKICFPTKIQVFSHRSWSWMEYFTHCSWTIYEMLMAYQQSLNCLILWKFAINAVWTEPIEGIHANWDIFQKQV